MNPTQTHDCDDTELHQPLVDLMRAKGLRLRESDQLIYPDDSDALRLRAGPPSQSILYLQVLDPNGHAVASGNYVENLRPHRSPFIGTRSARASERRRVLDALHRALLTIP